MGVFGHNGLLSKGYKSAKGYLFGDEEHPNGGIYIGGSTSTDMGFDLEEKQQSLAMGEAGTNGGYTKMFGSNTAYNEEQEKENSSWWDKNKDWITDVGGQLLTGVATAYTENYLNKQMQKDQNKWNAEQAQLNREFNASEAEKARQYETEMSNTAHQREMADLLATGLNPVNTATGGGGAATGGGNAASGSPASGTEPPYMNNSFANTALSLAEAMKVLNENKYISPEKKAAIANTIADTTNKSANTELTQAQKDLIKEQTQQISIDNISRDDMNKIEIALKSSQKKEVIENTIAQAIKNAYNTTTGTTPEQTTVERLTSLAASMLTENIKGN